MDAPFPGFPAAALQFLAALADHNNRAWFADHKREYEQALLAPAVAFVTAVGQRLQALRPPIQFDTRTDGRGSLMRIYRDTRFSADKTPYKTELTGMWWEGAGKKTAAPAFSFRLTATGMDLMAGQFGFDKAQLQQYRDAVVDAAMGARLQEAVTAVTAGGGYQLGGQHFKRVPRGADPDHPRADLLRHNGLYVRPRRSVSVDVVTSPRLVDHCLDHFEHMAPIQAWLVNALI